LIVRGIFAFKKEHSLAHVKLFEEHKLHPVIGKVFEWEDAVDAFRVSMEKSVMGKVVIKV
jgi:NADPH:quinone reductase-like Zn-dependent oxidoreductase